MPSHFIGHESEFSSETPRVMAIGSLEVGVFRLGGEIYAWRNICPHQGGPVCQGRIFRRVVEDSDAARQVHGRLYHPRDVNIVCPWHGAEFDIRTGHHAGTRRLQLSPVKIELRNGAVFAHVDSTDE